MRKIIINQNYNKASDIDVTIKNSSLPNIKHKDDCLVRIKYSAINMSDSLAAMGYFPHSVTPRVPGRDFVGIVEDGPFYMIGKKVWGSLGSGGIDMDGSLSEFISTSVDRISEVPKGFSLLEAGASILPYITAYTSLVTKARISKDDVVYVTGALGQVGKAAMSICKWKGARPIALVRGMESVEKAKEKGWDVQDTTLSNFAKDLFLNHGKANIILNSIGNIIWEEYVELLNDHGRIVTVGASPGKREVNIDLFKLYRANQEILGVNTVSLSSKLNASILNYLKPGFESGDLKMLEVNKKFIYPFESTSLALRKVMDNKSNARIIVEVNE